MTAHKHKVKHTQNTKQTKHETRSDQNSSLNVRFCKTRINLIHIYIYILNTQRVLCANWFVWEQAEEKKLTCETIQKAGKGKKTQSPIWVDIIYTHGSVSETLTKHAVIKVCVSKLYTCIQWTYCQRQQIAKLYQYRFTWLYLYAPKQWMMTVATASKILDEQNLIVAIALQWSFRSCTISLMIGLYTSRLHALIIEPMCSNKIINSILKEICDDCGIIIHCECWNWIIHFSLFALVRVEFVLFFFWSKNSLGRGDSAYWIIQI